MGYFLLLLIFAFNSQRLIRVEIKDYSDIIKISEMGLDIINREEKFLFILTNDEGFLKLKKAF